MPSDNESLNESIANDTKQRQRKETEAALIKHHCTAELAAWLTGIDIMLANIIEKHDKLEKTLAEYGIVEGGIPVNLHELHDIVHRLNGTLAKDEPDATTRTAEEPAESEGEES